MMDEHSTFWNNLWNDFIGVIIIVGYMVCSFISFLISCAFAVAGIILSIAGIGVIIGLLRHYHIVSKLINIIIGFVG